MISRSLLLLICLFVAEVVVAAPLDSRVERMTSEGSAAFALWGVYAEDVGTGKALVDVNGSRLFVPASNRKLVSTSMAAKRFGPDRTFKTELRAGRLSADGTVEGDLVLVPSGDPSWIPELLGGRPGQSKLTDLARQASAAGLERVTGNLVVRTAALPDANPLPPGWAADELDAFHAGRPALFSLNHNLGGISIEPGRVGGPVSAKAATVVEPFRIVVNAVTGSPGSAPTVRVVRSLEGRMVTLEGSLPGDSQPAMRSLPVGEPVQFNAAQLVEALRNEGIRIDGDVKLQRDAQAGDVLLGSVEGATVAQIITECNEESDNFLAESLYLLAGMDRYGSGGYTASHQLEQDFWKSLGVDTRMFIAGDGSGLSREDAVAPKAFVTLLRDMHDMDWWVESLPRSGYTGTLRYRLSADGMAGRVRAKTGTLDGVSALSGYVTTNGGRTIAFSVMANNYATSANSIRKTIDDIVVVLAGQ